MKRGNQSKRPPRNSGGLKTFFAKESDRWIDTALETAADDVKEAWAQLNAMLNWDAALENRP